MESGGFEESDLTALSPLLEKNVWLQGKNPNRVKSVYPVKQLHLKYYNRNEKWSY